MQQDYLQIRKLTTNNHYLFAQPHRIAQFGETFIWLLPHTLCKSFLMPERFGTADRGYLDALLRFAAIGEAYLEWAARHPTHFQVVSQRHLLDADAPARLALHNDAIRARMQALLEEAFKDTPSALARLPALQLLGRALVYGLSRMGVDGHFPEWDLRHASAPVAVRDAFVLFIELLAVGRDAQTSEAPGAPPRNGSMAKKPMSALSSLTA